MGLIVLKGLCQAIDCKTGEGPGWYFVKHLDLRLVFDGDNPVTIKRVVEREELDAVLMRFVRYEVDFKPSFDPFNGKGELTPLGRRFAEMGAPHAQDESIVTGALFQWRNGKYTCELNGNFGRRGQHRARVDFPPSWEGIDEETP